MSKLDATLQRIAPVDRSLEPAVRGHLDNLMATFGSAGVSDKA